MVALVRIHNEYECGRSSDVIESVRSPLPGESAETWWQDVVQPLTGDGHPCGSSEHALYEATITRIDDPELRPGDVMTWEG